MIKKSIRKIANHNKLRINLCNFGHTQKPTSTVGNFRHKKNISYISKLHIRCGGKRRKPNDE